MYSPRTLWAQDKLQFIYEKSREEKLVLLSLDLVESAHIDRAIALPPHKGTREKSSVNDQQ